MSTFLQNHSQPVTAIDNEQRVIPLHEAAARFGAADIDKFRKTAKKLKCLVKVADLDFVDMESFNERLREKAQAQAEAAKKSDVTRHKSGSQIGILKARLVQVPKHIANKEKAIENARQVLETATNNYERNRATKALEALEAGLDKLRLNMITDEEALNHILNAENSQLQSEAGTTEGARHE